jgi:CubicO group peptidase (beta-lactamase class C family)
MIIMHWCNGRVCSRLMVSGAGRHGTVFGLEELMSSAQRLEHSSLPDLDVSGLPGRVEAALRRALDEARIVGAVVLVARDGQLVYAGAAGLADREAGRVMDLEALFRLASLTKPIVSVTALALIGEGRLALDAPVTQWLPEFRPRAPDGSEVPIRVFHLLTHTSGLGYGFFVWEGDAYARAGVSNGLDQPGLSFDENARRLVSVPLLARPGAEFHYSLSTDVLGEVIARAADRSLPELVAERVTRPLGMTQTSFEVSDVERLVVPYADGRPQPERMRDAQHVLSFAVGASTYAPARALTPGSYASGGSGMIGTANEYLTFLEALRNADPRLLEPRLFAAMKQDQLRGLPAGPELGPGWGFGHGLGVLLDPARAQSPMRPGSLYWQGAYGNYFWVDPIERLSVLLLTNTAIEGMNGVLPADLRRAVYTP